MNNAHKISKGHWSLLKNSLYRKILVSTPFSFENNFVIGLQEKSEVSNSLFQQNFIFLVTNDYLQIEFCTSDIDKIIQNLDPNMDRGHDDISQHLYAPNMFFRNLQILTSYL